MGFSAVIVAVFVTPGTAVEALPSQVTANTPTHLTIAATLPPGARVVTAGVRSLTPGQRVRVTP